jgi:hypothetical protein
MQGFLLENMHIPLPAIVKIVLCHNYIVGFVTLLHCTALHCMVPYRLVHCTALPRPSPETVLALKRAVQK